jgi:hypothetical protein
MQLFYYNINGYPIAKIKPDNENNYDIFPSYFKNKSRNEIIDIYNKEVKCKSLIKILTEEELNDYDIKENNCICIESSLIKFFNKFSIL